MRKLGGVLAVALAWLTGAAMAQDTTGVTDTTIKIGVPGPLTGPNASFGAAIRGIEAYYKWVNENGGVHGRTIEVILGDTACDEAKGIGVAKRLISQEEVFLINGGVCSGVALAMRPVDHLTLKIEGQHIDGDQGIRAAHNPQGIEHHWQILAFKATVDF